LADIYYNRSGADYSRGLLRDGYINFGLQVPTYVLSKLDVNKYDDVPENGIATAQQPQHKSDEH